MNLPKFEIEDLLNTLDNYQKDNITSLLQTNTLEQTFEIWIKANGPENTASFGGNGHNNFSLHIKNELIKFFTDDPNYENERNELKKQGTITSFFAVSFISSTLFAHIGIVYNRRMNMGEINPRDLPNGVKYLGHLTDPSLDLYAYGEVYYDDWTNPEEPATKPLIPDNAVILISSHPNYMMAYGACTYIEQASGLWVTSQTSRLLRSYVEHHPDRRMVELQAHPLPIPDKVDSWLVATVC